MILTIPTNRRFALGDCYATAGALAKFDRETLFRCLSRHAAGDWGDLDEEDRGANDAALAGAGRLMSSYRFPDGGKLWAITEADRSATTLLMPEDY